MKPTKTTTTFAVAALACAAAFGFSAGAAHAQTPAAPAPTPTPRMNVVSAEYDGKTHMTLTPYVWLPTINGQFAYPVPVRRPGAAGGTTAIINTQVGPNSYLSHLNFAAMGAFEIRKGDVAAFADFITLNATDGTQTTSSISGPLGKVQVPVDLGTTGRISSTIWEAAGSYTVAHSDTASIELLGGWRQATLNGTLNWNLNVGKNSFINSTGSVFKKDQVSDIIFGARGKVAFGDSGWFVPYYFDAGTGDRNNQTWQAYGGIAHAGRGGAILLLFRELNYTFDGGSYIQKIRFGGPLLGYSIKL